jgi:hypothetical protein
LRNCRRVGARSSLSSECPIARWLLVAWVYRFLPSCARALERRSRRRDRVPPESRRIGRDSGPLRGPGGSLDFSLTFVYDVPGKLNERSFWGNSRGECSCGGSVSTVVSPAGGLRVWAGVRDSRRNCTLGDVGLRLAATWAGRQSRCSVGVGGAPIRPARVAGGCSFPRSSTFAVGVFPPCSDGARRFTQGASSYDRRRS